MWERPLRRADLEALGDAAPDGPILGARVEHLVAKEALLADDPAVFFTTPHFDGYPAVLVRLERIGLEDLREVIVEAWLARAPKRLAEAYLRESEPRRGVADGLDVVAVGVEHEGAVVVRVVDLAHARARRCPCRPPRARPRGRRRRWPGPRP